MVMSQLEDFIIKHHSRLDFTSKLVAKMVKKGLIETIPAQLVAEWLGELYEKKREEGNIEDGEIYLDLLSDKMSICEENLQKKSMNIKRYLSYLTNKAESSKGTNTLQSETAAEALESNGKGLLEEFAAETPASESKCERQLDEEFKDGKKPKTHPPETTEARLNNPPNSTLENEYEVYIIVNDMLADIPISGQGVIVKCIKQVSRFSGLLRLYACTTTAQGKRKWIKLLEMKQRLKFLNEIGEVIGIIGNFVFLAFSNCSILMIDLENHGNAMQRTINLPIHYPDSVYRCSLRSSSVCQHNYFCFDNRVFFYHPLVRLVHHMETVTGFLLWSYDPDRDE